MFGYFLLAENEGDDDYVLEEGRNKQAVEKHLIQSQELINDWSLKYIYIFYLLIIQIKALTHGYATYKL